MAESFVVFIPAQYTGSITLNKYLLKDYIRGESEVPYKWVLIFVFMNLENFLNSL